MACCWESVTVEVIGTAIIIMGAVVVEEPFPKGGCGWNGVEIESQQHNNEENREREGH